MPGERMKRLNDAVQPPNWQNGLPRPEYRRWRRLSSACDWFEIYKLPNRVFALYEPGHFQEVISFLICGQKRALLFDSGLGIGDIKKEVERLTQLETFVVNSHFHFDHIGGNRQFSEVYLFDDAFAVRRLNKGYTREELSIHLSGDSCQKPFPAGFDPADYSIPPQKALPLYTPTLPTITTAIRTFRLIASPSNASLGCFPQ